MTTKQTETETEVKPTAAELKKAAAAAKKAAADEVAQNAAEAAQIAADEAKKAVEEAAAEAPAETPAPVVTPEKLTAVNTPVVEAAPAAKLSVSIKNNGPRSYETYTRTDLPAGKTVVIECPDPAKRKAIIRKLRDLNALNKNNRYEVAEV